MKLPAHPVKTGQARLGLPGNEEYDYKVGFDSTAGVRYRPPATPLRRDRQGGASSRLAREFFFKERLKP